MSKKAKKKAGPNAMTIVGRCLSIRIAIRMIRVARMRLRIDGPKSSWVSDTAPALDARLKVIQEELVGNMRDLWPTAADETAEWLKTEMELPPELRPPYMAPNGVSP